MSTTKMTFTIPNETHASLISTIPKSKRSRFITFSIEEKLSRLRRKNAFKMAEGILKDKNHLMWATPKQTSLWLKKERTQFERKIA